MHPIPRPIRKPTWGLLLPREAFQEIILILRGALPPPLSEDPAEEIRRDRAAMAGVAALKPVNAAEGRLAAQFVAADAWAMDCLRLAQVKRREPDLASQMPGAGGEHDAGGEIRAARAAAVAGGAAEGRGGRDGGGSGRLGRA